MASTPPRVSGSPQEESWRRWAEEKLLGSENAQEQIQTRVRAVELAATNVGSVATNADQVARDEAERVVYPNEINRITYDLRDSFHWQQVIDGKASAFGKFGPSQARHVSILAGDQGGLYFQPTLSEGAEIEVAGIHPIPRSRKIFIEVESGDSLPAPSVWIDWRDATGKVIDEDGVAHPTLVTQKVIQAPGGVVATYSVRLARAATATPAGAISLSIFEVIGDGNLNISPDGIQIEDGSGDTTLEIRPSLPILAAPTVPILASDVGTVSVRWDGSLTSGPAPAHLAYVYTEEADSAAGPWTRVGQVLNRSGYLMTRPPVASVRFYRFIAVDTSNRPSPPSASISTTVGGVSLDAIDPSLKEDIDQIRYTTDGLNRIYTSPIQPVADTINLAPNPSFEASLSLETARTNIVLNPTARVNLDNWYTAVGGGIGGVVALSRLETTSVIPGVTTYGLIRLVTPGTWWDIRVNAAPNSVVAGATYTVSAVVNSALDDVRVGFYWLDASGGTVSESWSTNPLPTNSWTRVSHTAVAPVGAVSVRVAFRSVSTVVDSVFRVAAVLVERSPIDGGFFDGEYSPDGELIPGWTGDENASTSTLVYHTPVGTRPVSPANTQARRSDSWGSTGRQSLRNVYIGTSSTPPSNSGTIVVAEAHDEYGIPSFASLGFSDGDVVTVSARAYIAAAIGATGVPASLYTTGGSVTPPNIAGEYTLTKTFTLTSALTDTVHLRGATLADNGGVWWDNFMIVRGEYSGPFVQAFRNGDIWWVTDASGDSIIGVQMWNGAEWVPYQLVADTIIAAESITAPLIKAGSINVNHVEPAFGDALDISANSSVTIIVGRQDDIDDSVTDLDARLDNHQTYYGFLDDGLRIGDPDTTAELRLKPDRIQMTQSGAVVSEWVGGVFIADEVRLQKSAVIGNHQWLEYGAGRTIVRPLS